MADAGDVWLTTSQVADRLGVDPSTVWRTPRGELPYRLTRAHRGHRRYLEADVERYRASLYGEDPPAGQ